MQVATAWRLGATPGHAAGELYYWLLDEDVTGDAESSAVFGSLVLPNVCTEPDAENPLVARGYQILDQAVVQTWAFVYRGA